MEQRSGRRAVDCEQHASGGDPDYENGRGKEFSYNTQ
jgi:hypothetical protein